MPISPIVLQRRHAELGRIRLGAKAETSSGRTRPAKLEAFRFTSVSERYIRDLAELYGGDPRAWDNNGVPSWEVYTDATSIPVIAVKGGLSQWMETWSGGGCIHRCDGEQNVDGTYCDPEDRAHRDAKPTTRLSVMLPELEAIGVWRMESHGWNAAAEIPAVAELAQYVGDLVPANLNLVQRRSVRDGQTSRFVVPVLDLQIGTARLKEIVAAKSGAPALETADGSSGAPELEAPAPGPAPGYGDALGAVAAAQDLDRLRQVWEIAKDQGLVGADSAATAERDQFVEIWKARAQELQAATAPLPQVQEPDQDGAVDAELVPETATEPTGDPDAIWQQILTAGGTLGWDLDRIASDFRDSMGMIPDEASAAELSAYLQQMRSGEQVPA